MSPAAPARVVHIHAEAPPKPAVGAPCNGCGLCCLYAPCPLGMLRSQRRHGACKALTWDASARHYRCGMLQSPSQQFWGRPFARLDGWLRPLVRRWIAAGHGCDAALTSDHTPPRQTPR